MTTPDFLKPPEKVSGKRYGELHHVKDDQRDYWVVSGHPHMIGVLKRVFPVCKTLHGGSQSDDYYQEHAAGSSTVHGAVRGHSIEFPLTKRNIGDLNWFMMRYPLDVKDPLDWEHLLKGAQQHYEKLESMLEKPTKITPPPMFIGRLKEFQKEGLAFLCHNERALLADECGLGKTPSALAWLTTLTDGPPWIIVVPPHLLEQWKREIKKFLGDVSVHIIRGQTQYPLPKADIYLIHYLLLMHWKTVLPEYGFHAAVFDEIHEMRHSGTEKYSAASLLASSTDYIAGLSVGPDSTVSLRGGVFGSGWHGTIENAWQMVRRYGVQHGFDSHDLVRTEDVQVRGWQEGHFEWKSVKTFIKHPLCGQVTRMVQFAGSRALMLTDSHSIYVAKPNGDITPAKAHDIKVRDILLHDDGSNWDSSAEVPVDMIRIASQFAKSKVQISLPPIGSLKSVQTRKALGISILDWNNYRRQGHYVSYLPLVTYVALAGQLPRPSRIYLAPTKSSNWMPPLLYLSRIAYLLGFWLGDGWFNENRICFAVEISKQRAFTKYLDGLKSVFGMTYTVRPAHGRSVEVRAGNVLLVSALREVLGDCPKCYEKVIPAAWIYEWPRKARMELLHGLIDSDGHVRIKKPRVYYTTTSPSLANSLLLLLTSLGLKGSLTITDQRGSGGTVRGKKIVGRHLTYNVNWSYYAMNGRDTRPFGSPRALSYSRGSFNECRVRETRLSPSQPESVYDIEVTGHPSFVANDILVHNSGTPFFNYGGEIWNVLNILEDKILGDYASFSREWCWGYFGKQIAKPAEFGAFLKEQGLLLRRLKEDVMSELPPKRRVIQSVDVDEGQYAELIAPVVDQALAIPQIQKAWDRGRAEMMAIDETRRITGISKAHYVAAFVETLLEAGEPCILYGHHHDVIDLWLEDLRAGHHHPVFITGRQDAKAKDEAQQLFMDGKTDVICVSMRSGTGLNLQRARCVVFGELDWSPAQHTQNEDRAHRIGQRDSVLCYYLVCDAGTDQAMLETLGLKTSQFVEIMGDRPETEADRLNAQKDVKLHMQEVIKTLQKGGKKKVEPTLEIAQKIELLERMPRKVREPALDGFDDTEVSNL